MPVPKLYFPYFIADIKTTLLIGPILDSPNGGPHTGILLYIQTTGKVKKPTEQDSVTCFTFWSSAGFVDLFFLPVSCCDNVYGKLYFVEYSLILTIDSVLLAEAKISLLLNPYLFWLPIQTSKHYYCPNCFMLFCSFRKKKC